MKSKITKVVVSLFFLAVTVCNIQAQSQKGIAEIKDLTRNTDGKISWEIYYTSRNLQYQLEFFNNGEWLVNSTFKQNVSMIVPGQKEEFFTRDSIKASTLVKYRLRITEPVNISKEVQ
ncbi:MAG: hypothetical protein K0Q95_1821 [Bacteroidota bacterium]|jgi:hypothetical protein|nr:hypothetical protein [Bacteroidota bacterium]